MIGWTSGDTAVVVVANACVIAGFVFWQVQRMVGRNRSLYDALQRNNQLLERVEDEWRFQHRQGTYVGSLHGLWKALEAGLERGGLDPQVRRMIYQAGEEMFDRYYRETAAREQLHRDRDGAVSEPQSRAVLFE